MIVGELLRADHKREPGGGRFLRAGSLELVPGGGCTPRLSRFQKPSLAAGFFVATDATPAASANSGRRLWNLIRARLWLALLPTVCVWVTACSCFPGGTRPITIQQVAGFTTPSTEVENEVNLTVLTFNVWGIPSWMNHEPRTRYARIAMALGRLHPDLVLLQEVWTKSAQAVVPTSGGWLVAEAPSPNFFRRNGLVVLSRMPISGGEFHPFSEASFPDSLVCKGALKVTVEAPGGERLNIWNVHLQADAPRVCLRQIKQLAAWVRDADDGQAADLVGGDFNSTPGSPEFKLLSRELGETAHEIAHLPFTPTYDGLSVDPKKGQTIDYLFIRRRTAMNQLEATPTITFTNANPRERFSDHVALEVTLRFHAESFFVSGPFTNGLSRQPVAYSSRVITPLSH